MTKIDRPIEEIRIRQALMLAKRLGRIGKERHCGSVTVMLDD